MASFLKRVPGGTMKVSWKTCTFLCLEASYLINLTQFLGYKMLHLGLLYFVWISFWFIFKIAADFYETFTIGFFFCAFKLYQNTLIGWHSPMSVKLGCLEFNKTTKNIFVFVSFFVSPHRPGPSGPSDLLDALFVQTFPLLWSLSITVTTRQAILCLEVSEYHNCPLQTTTVVASMAITQMAAAFSSEAHWGPVEHSRHFLNTCFRGKKRKNIFCRDLHPQWYSKLNVTIPWATRSNLKAWSSCKFGTALIRGLHQITSKVPLQTKFLFDSGYQLATFCSIS